MEDWEKELIRRRQWLDQQEEDLINNAPRVWYRMYDQLIKEGFRESQALALLFHFMEITHRIGE